MTLKTFGSKLEKSQDLGHNVGDALVGNEDNTLDHSD